MRGISQGISKNWFSSVIRTNLEVGPCVCVIFDVTAAQRCQSKPALSPRSPPTLGVHKREAMGTLSMPSRACSASENIYAGAILVCFPQFVVAHGCGARARMDYLDITVRAQFRNRYIVLLRLASYCIGASRHPPRHRRRYYETIYTKKAPTRARVAPTRACSASTVRSPAGVVLEAVLGCRIGGRLGGGLGGFEASARCSDARLRCHHSPLPSGGRLGGCLGGPSWMPSWRPSWGPSWRLSWRPSWGDLLEGPPPSSSSSLLLRAEVASARVHRTWSLCPNGQSPT